MHSDYCCLHELLRWAPGFDELLWMSRMETAVWGGRPDKEEGIAQSEKLEG